MPCFVQPRRRLWNPAEFCLWGGDLSRYTTGVGEVIVCSEKDTISPNHDGCILQFDVILQDVCGNVYLHFGICSDNFLLASRYNIKKERKKERERERKKERKKEKKERKRERERKEGKKEGRKEENLFQRKTFPLNKEDPHFRVGSKEGIQEKRVKAGSLLASALTSQRVGPGDYSGCLMSWNGVG